MLGHEVNTIKEILKRPNNVLAENRVGVQALDYLAEKVWDRNVRPADWLKRGAVSKGKKMVEKKSLLPWKKSKLVAQDNQHEVDDEVIWNAEFAYSVLYSMLTFAEKHNVPIRQDG